MVNGITGVPYSTLARAGEPVAPDYQKPIEAYPTFDWPSIGATVTERDQDGPTIVEWEGKSWKRRSPSNKFDPAIWFSRSIGRGEDGEIAYARLITFKPTGKIDKLPEQTRQASTAGGTKPSAPASSPAPVNGNNKAAPVVKTEITNAEPAQEFVSAVKYYGEIGKITIPEARSIATFAGVDVNGRNQNFADAYPLLSYFREGKSNGLDMGTLKSILKEREFDLTAALIAMRAQVPQS